jgi:hypothetical protein
MAAIRKRNMYLEINQLNGRSIMLNRVVKLKTESIIGDE